MQTSNDMVRVEDMTLNIWCTTVESVVFGQGQGNEQRQILAMRSNDAKSKALDAHLQGFIANQSVLVAPKSGADVAKMHNLSNSEQLMKAATDKVQGALGLLQPQASIAAAAAPAPAPAASKAFCTGCGAALAAGARFCSVCGQAAA